MSSSPSMTVSERRGDMSMGKPASPKQLALGSDDEVYKGAMKVLVEAASKFNRETTAGQLYMKSLENRELDKELFRQSLRSGMNCRLTEREFDMLMPHFENKQKPDCVNGCDFILLFYRIRFEHRAELLTNRIEKEKKFRLKDKEFLEKRRAEIESKNDTDIDLGGSKEDKEKALEKVRVAAWKFDKGAPGAPDLGGFDCMSLTPNAFKDVLRRTFNLKFTPKEFGAFLREVCDPEDPDMKVHCASFLVYFQRKGFLEREKLMKAQWAERERIDEERASYEKGKLEEQEGKNRQKVSKFTEADKGRALEKLRDAAKHYDKSMPGAMSMQNFEMAYMEPHVFREQLRRVFNLRVSGPELGAIISIFDEAGTGMIPCQEFAKTFLAMGFAEREARDKKNLELQRKAEVQMKVEAEAKLQALESKAKIKVADKYEEGDFHSAVEKMDKCAEKFDKSAPGAPNLDAFDMKHMEPHVFKEQLRRAFGLVLEGPELAALLTKYDPRGTGNFDCQEFLRQFLRRGFEIREGKSKRWREFQRKNEELAKKEAAEKLEKASRKKVLNLGDFEREDFDSAMEALDRGAQKYIKRPGDTLDAFEAKNMPAHVFQSQLKMAFNIDINPRELAALMNYYDPNKTGTINCKDFLNAFLRKGYTARAQLEDGWRKERLAKQERDEMHWLNKEEEKALKAMAEVDFEFTEDDFDEALWKFVKVCHDFELRQLGPAGWSGFTASTLTPAEFREMMKRTFGLKVSPKELGALVTYFQKDFTADSLKRRVLNCQFFLNCFVQARVNTEAMKGKEDEVKLMVAYKEKLKVEYRERRDKSGTTMDARRPWRATATVRKGPGGTTSLKQIMPYPETPEQKIARRFLAGKTTGILDLATKKLWPELADDPTAGLVQVGVEKKEKKKSRKKTTTLLATGSNLRDRAKNVAEFAKAAAVAVDDHTLRADFRLLNIPAETWKLQMLEQIWLDNNMLGGIPHEIGQLVNLRTLGLSKNDLNSIPEEVCSLPHLKRLIAQRNNLKSLPDDFVKLQTLRELDMSHNKFTKFPQVLVEMPRMEILHFEHNEIARLPMELRNMRSLYLLNLEFNEFSKPPEVLEKMYHVQVMGVPLRAVKTSATRFNVSDEQKEDIHKFLAQRAKATQERLAQKNKRVL